MAALDYFDTYALQGRFAPAFVTILPLGLALGAWFPASHSVYELPSGTLLALAGAVFTSHLGRDLGRRMQPQLFTTWGGAPTSQEMSFIRSTLNPNTLVRIHEKLNALVPGCHLPMSREEELRDTELAATNYESAIDWLRERTGDRTVFPLVAAENAGFGFRRNLFAMKPAGVLASAVSCVAIILRLASNMLARQPLDNTVVVSGVLCVALLVLWLLRVRMPWVRESAFAYARQLILSTEKL